MKLRPIIILPLLGITLITVLGSTPSFAQWRGFRSPAQMALRGLGHGFGPGYHWRTPGPNSDYYNPYSAHNSMLISQMGPQPQQSMYLEGNRPHQSILPSQPDSQYSTKGISGGDFQIAPRPTTDPRSKPIDSDETDSSEDTDREAGAGDSTKPPEGQQPTTGATVLEKVTVRSTGKVPPPKPVGYKRPVSSDKPPGDDWSLEEAFPIDRDR